MRTPAHRGRQPRIQRLGLLSLAQPSERQGPSSASPAKGLDFLALKAAAGLIKGNLKLIPSYKKTPRSPPGLGPPPGVSWSADPSPAQWLCRGPACPHPILLSRRTQSTSAQRLPLHPDSALPGSLRTVVGAGAPCGWLGSAEAAAGCRVCVRSPPCGRWPRRAILPSATVPRVPRTREMQIPPPRQPPLLGRGLWKAPLHVDHAGAGLALQMRKHAQRS